MSCPNPWQEDFLDAAAAAQAILAGANGGSAGGATAVYRAVYAGGWRGTGPRPDAAAPEALTDTRFAAAVAAIDGTRFEGGWTVESVRDGEVLLERDGLRARAERVELDRRPVRGSSVGVATPIVSAGRLPGFVHRIGPPPEPPLSRIYLHLRPNAARWLVDAYGCTLERLGIGYELKVLAHPANYFRGDAGVVVVSKGDAERVAHDVAARAVPDRLMPEPATPLLTERIADGVSRADHPHDWDTAGAASHGMWVTELLCWAAEQSATKDRDELSTMLTRRIADLGREASAPWLLCAS